MEHATDCQPSSTLVVITMKPDFAYVVLPVCRSISVRTGLIAPNQSHLTAPLLNIMWKLTVAQRLVALSGMAATTLLLTFQKSASVRNDNDGVTLDNMDEEDDMSSGFCEGMHMVMSTSGFQWSLSGHGDCLTYFAPAWKLDGRGKFEGAMVYTFLLAIVAEGSHALFGLLRPYVPKGLQHLAKSILYGVQRFMTYIIMLIAMMYSWELLIAVICGVMVGRLLFPNFIRREWRREARQRNNPDSSRHPTLATTLDETGTGQDEDIPLADDGASMRRRR